MASSLEHSFEPLTQCPNVASVTGSTDLDMKTVFRPRLYGIYADIMINMRRKKLQIINQQSNYPGGSFGHKDILKFPITCRKKKQSQNPKR